MVALTCLAGAFWFSRPRGGDTTAGLSRPLALFLDVFSVRFLAVPCYLMWLHGRQEAIGPTFLWGAGLSFSALIGGILLLVQSEPGASFSLAAGPVAVVVSGSGTDDQDVRFADSPSGAPAG